MSTNVTVFLLCLPLVAAAAGWATERTGVPLPVLLVATGALLSLSPWFHAPELSPQVVLFVFLPPLVYYAAYFLAPEDLRANAWPIGLLAVGLVIATMIAVAAVMVGVAGVSLTVAAVAGAVVASTDSVAPTSVFQRLSVPERLVTLQAFAFLEVLVFLLNAVLFTLVGVQLVRVVIRALDMPTGQVLAVIATVTTVVVGSRMVWTLLGPAATWLRDRTEQPTAWREGIVVGWAGVRGGVSLAAAMAVPLQRADGSPFPDRDLVIVVTAGVIVVTLMAQGMSLPWLLRKLGIAREDTHRQEQLARLQAVRTALAVLDKHARTQGADEAVESLRASYAARARRLEATDKGQLNGPSGVADEPQRYLALRLKLLEVERSAVFESWQQGRISMEVYRVIERSLDLEEARIRGA